MKKILIIMILLISKLAFSSAGYTIENYDVKIKITKNNIYNIDEEIKVNFTEVSRGIYRIIPQFFNGRKIPVTDIRANEPVYINNERNQMFLRIGDPNKYVMGENFYKISFSQNIGWDRTREQDEVYYNIVGNDWETTIEKVSFQIELPEEFDSSKLNFTRGLMDSTDTTGIVWSVNGKIIKGETTRRLYPKEALTIALPLPEGFFYVNKLEGIKDEIIRGFLYILLMLIPLNGLRLRKKYKNETPLVETVEFYPPDNMSPTEIGYYYDGKIDNKDLTSLIIYWANKKYLNIIEGEEQGKTREVSLEFTTTLENFNNENLKKNYEIIIFKALYDKKDERNRVNLSSLKNKFYQVIEKSERAFLIDVAMEKKGIYNSRSLMASTSVMASSFLWIPILLINFTLLWNTNIQSKLIVLLAIVSFISTLIIGSKISSRTDYAVKILGKILGFKRFLEKAEKNRLEALINNDPSYFYKILPYTIVLGVSKVWVDKFSDIVVKPPEWYSDGNIGQTFALNSFMRSINNTQRAVKNNLQSSPPPTSSPRRSSNFGGGSSSSRGGSSGRGGGGGGGGRW